MPKKSLKKYSERLKHKKSNRKMYKRHKTYRKHGKINKRQFMKGGYGTGMGPVGYPWQSDPSTWPGQYVSNGGNTNGMTFSNYYDYNSQGAGVGGLNHAISTRGNLDTLNYQNGGAGIFQGIANLANYKISDFFSKLNGAVNPPVNPDVTKQFINSNTNYNPKINIPNTLNLNEIITNSSNQIAEI